MTAARWSLAGWPLAVALIAALATAGCTAGEAGPSAAGPTVQRQTQRAGLIAGRLPRVEYLGGRFLRHPTVHTVTFTTDDPEVAARLERFGDAITSSSWWREVTAGYCAAHDC